MILIRSFLFAVTLLAMLALPGVSVLAADFPYDPTRAKQGLHENDQEALERFYGGADAKIHYDAGVTAAFARYGENAAPFIAPGGNYVYPSTGSFEEKLEAIGTLAELIKVGKINPPKAKLFNFSDTIQAVSNVGSLSAMGGIAIKIIEEYKQEV